MLHSLFYELHYTYFESIIGHRIKGSTSVSGWIIYLELTDVILIQFEVSPHPQFVHKGMQTFFFIGSGWRMHQHDKYFSGGKKRYTLWISSLSFKEKKKKRRDNHNTIHNISFISNSHKHFRNVNDDLVLWDSHLLSGKWIHG